MGGELRSTQPSWSKKGRPQGEMRVGGGDFKQRKRTKLDWLFGDIWRIPGDSEFPFDNPIFGFRGIAVVSLPAGHLFHGEEWEIETVTFCCFIHFCARVRTMMWHPHG